MRLDPRLRAALYCAISTLIVTGVVWLVADRLKDGVDGERWLTIASHLLMAHGGAAMITLMMLGALVPLHVRRGWRAGKNHITGAAMATTNITLIATSFGLYYLGSDVLRPWASDLHIAAGLLLPAVFVVHLIVGRRKA